MTATSALSLADQVLTRLRTLEPGVTVYDGELVDEYGNPTEPSTDSDGRVSAYAVLYPAPGHARGVTLDQTPDTLDWSAQVTAVGGDRTRALWCVDRVRGALAGARLATSGGQSVVLVEDGDPGPLRRDDQVRPSRFYVPLRFATTA